MKTCTRCKTEKPISEFYADNRRKDGKLSRCKTCKNEMLRQYRKELGPFIRRAELKASEARYRGEAPAA